MGFGYDWKRTVRKLFEDFLLYGLPQLVGFLLARYPDFSTMTVAGLVGMGLKWLKDYLKHR